MTDPVSASVEAASRPHLPAFAENSDDSVVVVVGSGADGGTLGNELCRAGVRVVCLEAGPHLTADDDVNDAWPALNQMVWTDPRTTWGSHRVARDFPDLPGVDGQGRRRDVHEAATTYGDVAGASLLDWPITLADLEPYLRPGRDQDGGHAPARPAAAARQRRLEVFANGRRRSATSSTPRVLRDERRAVRRSAGRRRDGCNFQGDQTGVPSGRRWWPSCPRPSRRATWTCVPAATSPRSRTTRAARSTASSTSRTVRSTGSRPASSASSASPATPSRPRGCSCCPARRSSRTAWPTARGRSGATTCAT